MEILMQNQSIAVMVLITTSASLGLIVLALFQGVLWQIRITKANAQQNLMLDKIYARLLIEPEYEIEMQGSPVSLEDLIRRDLEEQMEDPNNLQPPTEEELLDIMKEVKQ